MIFLPNKSERFAAALRNNLHKNALKNGISPRHIKNMRKIIIFEALKCQKDLFPLDITEHASKLLSLIYIRKLHNFEYFVFSIKAKGRYMLNPKLFSCFILSLAKTSEKIEIFEKDKKIIITSKNPTKESLYIAKSIKSMIFHEKKTGEALFVLSPDTTDKEPIPCSFELQNILDPFSAVNVFI